MNKSARILVTGAGGLVGSSIIRKLKESGYKQILQYTSKQVDLTDRDATMKTLLSLSPKYIFHCAALVGGIKRNMAQPADFGMKNSEINNNVIRLAHECKSKLLFLGSSCIYPRECPQPMKEEYLLTGPCEPTNEMYALSKIYGIKLCEAYRKQYRDNFITCQPRNVYGEGDHFDLENAHVVGALINRFHTAKENGDGSVKLWGTGSAKRELLYVDDLASACVHLMETYNDRQMLNIGTGIDYTIKEIAETIKGVIGYTGDIEWDHTKPDGMPRKVVDVTRIHELGWNHTIDLEDGIKKTYQYFLSSQ